MLIKALSWMATTHNFTTKKCGSHKSAIQWQPDEWASVTTVTRTAELVNEMNTVKIYKQSFHLIHFKNLNRKPERSLEMYLIPQLPGCFYFVLQMVIQLQAKCAPEEGARWPSQGSIMRTEGRKAYSVPPTSTSVLHLLLSGFFSLSSES